MMIGELLRRLGQAPDDSLALELVPDLALLAQARAAAAESGTSLSRYLMGACRHFMDAAPEDAWTGLIGQWQDGSEPGRSFVEAALRRHLHDGHKCSCGGR